MRITIISATILILSASPSFSQQNIYRETIDSAVRYFEQENYVKAAQMYSTAFKRNKDLGRLDHRYNAAKAWIHAENPDSALYQLKRVADSRHYTNLIEIENEEDFKALHKDIRWINLIRQVTANKADAEKTLNAPLVAILDTVYYHDQNIRNLLQQIQNTYGTSSEQVKLHWKKIAHTDSINQIKVSKIIDTHGWLGSEVVGPQGNSALFLVIQHADIDMQEKYLPIMRDAVKNGKLKASSLALLEDRVALKRGGMQIYGSQIGSIAGGPFYVLPLIDPENVDKRRAEVKLTPMSEYVSHWGIIWSLEQYKKGIERSVVTPALSTPLKEKPRLVLPTPK